MDINQRFIDALVAGTKRKSISWDYLDNDVVLQTNLWSNSATLPSFYPDDSFFTSFNNAYFILLSMKDEMPSGEIDHVTGYPETYYVDGIKLYIVPPTFRDVKIISTFNDNDYSEGLIRLRNLIKKDFPNSEDIMEKFISENL